MLSNAPPVKVCGISRPDDAAFAVALGASAIGFVFWPESPRYVELIRAREIADALPDGVLAVGVFVDQPVSRVVEIADTVGLDAIQLHGNESVSDFAGLRQRVIKAVAVGASFDPASVDAFPENVTLLLDAHDPIRRGGTGQRIDWSIAEAIARQRPVILSGGLNAGNLVLALETVRPAAIDVSSGVESAPGKKDPDKLRALFDVLRHTSFSSFGIRHSSLT
jgi:phosphoribosylanthranilate isomerase